MGWLELTVNVRRQGMTEKAFAVLTVIEHDHELEEDNELLHEVLRMEVPISVPEEALTSWITTTIGQVYNTFRFNTTIRKLPIEKRRELQPPLFDESFFEDNLRLRNP